MSGSGEAVSVSPFSFRDIARSTLILRRSRSDRLEGDSRDPRMRNVRFQSPCQGIVRKVDPVFTGVARWVRAERCHVKEGSIGLIPKVDSTFGSDALGRLGCGLAEIVTPESILSERLDEGGMGRALGVGQA